MYFCTLSWDKQTAIVTDLCTDVVYNLQEGTTRDRTDGVRLSSFQGGNFVKFQDLYINDGRL